MRMTKPLPFSLLLAAPVLTACNTVPTNHSDNPTANFYAVDEGLVYRGSRPTYQGVEELAGMSIHTIIDLEDNGGAVKDESGWAAALGMKEITAPIASRAQPDSASVQLALDTLADSANMPIFVHCAKGQDRTGMIVALHRIFNQGWDAQDAKDEMEAHGFDDSLHEMKQYFEMKAGLE
jgi:protein tyrosine/serine phosphatase